MPEDVARSVDVPTLVLAGGDSPEFFRRTAEHLTRLVPGARLTVLADQDHGADPAVLGPVIRDFVTG